MIDGYSPEVFGPRRWGRPKAAPAGVHPPMKLNVWVDGFNLY